MIENLQEAEKRNETKKGKERRTGGEIGTETEIEMGRRKEITTTEIDTGIGIEIGRGRKGVEIEMVIGRNGVEIEMVMMIITEAGTMTGIKPHLPLQY